MNFVPSSDLRNRYERIWSCYSLFSYPTPTL